MTDEIQAAHILLMDSTSDGSSATRTKEEARAEITNIQSRLAEGADFGDLAREHSDCPSGKSGGDLGVFGRGMMVAEFETAAFALEVGTTSDIVETPFGYHLIQRTA